MRRKRILTAVIALALALTMFSGSALAASRSAKVASASMTVYRGAGKGRIGILPRGASVKVTAVSGSWAKISYKGKTGYVRIKNLAFSGERVKAVTREASSIRFITKSSYRKRSYYTGTLAAGTTIYLSGERGGSYLFYSEDGSMLGLIKKSVVDKAE